jgi:hypothetical protein
MIRRATIATLIALVLAPAAALAQDPVPVATPPRPAVIQIQPPQSQSGITALMVDVTLSRYLNDKRLSSTPYTVSVVPGFRSQLRMGGDVPVPSTTFTPVKEGEKSSAPLTSYSYRNIGTSIDITAEAVVNAQWRLSLSIDDSSIYPADLAPPSTKTTGAPAFRSFKSVNAITLRDGQSLDYTMATDRLTGEVYRVSVKLTVVK